MGTEQRSLTNAHFRSFSSVLPGITGNTVIRRVFTQTSSIVKVLSQIGHNCACLNLLITSCRTGQHVYLKWKFETGKKRKTRKYRLTGKNPLGGSGGKELTCQCRRHKRHRFDPWVGEIPWRRAWQPTPVLLPGEFHGQKSLAGYGPKGYKESDMN